MMSRAIREWLAEYKGLSDEKVHTFACTLRENMLLVHELYAFFECRPSIEELDPVCHQLYEFYRSKEENLRRFVLELIPSLIGLYLRCLSYNDKKACNGLEAFLLGVYNLAIVRSDGSPMIIKFRIPSISQGSIYHESVPPSSLALTESILNRYNRPVQEWRGGPYPHYESINGHNRQAVLSQLLQAYNADIARLAAHSHNSLCLTASKISLTGLPSLQISPSQLESWTAINETIPEAASTSSSCQCPRMAVSPALLVEMLWGINYSMYNGCDKVARDAIRDIHARACYELLPDIQMMTEAILNSDSLTMGKMEDEEPMGIFLASVAATPHASLSKGTLTNASFKTKKLPDDIPITQEAGPQEPVAQPSTLPPIEEEQKGVARHVLRLSKSRTKKEKEEKEKQQLKARDGCKGLDASSSMSLVQNSESTESASVSVFKSQSNGNLDSLELRQITSKQSNEDQPITTNCNNSATTRRRSVEKDGGEERGEHPCIKPNSLGDSLVNTESYSTDL